MKLTASKVISDSVTFLYCLRRYESGMSDMTEEKKQATERQSDGT